MKDIINKMPIVCGEHWKKPVPELCDEDYSPNGWLLVRCDKCGIKQNAHT